MATIRTQRLIQILQMLQSGRKYDADGLASDLSVSRRTLFRDLKILEDAGVRFGYDKRTQRYSVDKDYFLPPVNLTLGEALALMLVTRKLTARRIHPEHRQAVEAAMKIESNLPAHIRDHCGSLMQKIDAKHWPVSDVEGVRQVFDTLQRAIHQQHKVAMRYDSYFDGGVIEMVLRPYRIAFLRRGWYVVGHSELHDEVRMFKLERVEHIAIEGVRFTLPRDFELEVHLGNAWQMIRGDERFHVSVRFSAKVAGNVEEVLWHKTQSTHRDGDGSLIFEVDVDGLGEIAWWILGYGDEAEVLDPPELRAMIAERVQRMAAIYDGRGSNGKSK